jgi:hypothetical protein
MLNGLELLQISAVTSCYEHGLGSVRVGKFLSYLHSYHLDGVMTFIRPTMFTKNMLIYSILSQ